MSVTSWVSKGRTEIIYSSIKKTKRLCPFPDFEGRLLKPIPETNESGHCTYEKGPGTYEKEVF